MLVYQALLLGGYGYAHLIGRLPPRRQAILHLILLLGAALMLPIGLVAATPSASANPFFWVPYLFVASIGPLFFVISAQAPLLQRWYAQAGGGDPYPLYAASNLGSFGGLIAYPLVVEPLLPLNGQSWLWSAGYVAVVLLVGLCALTLPRSVPDTNRVSAQPLAPRQVMLWIALAAVPSGLMLSTTTHLTTDIVAMPLLWVLPLGLYLLSFSIAFSENRALPRTIIAIAPLILMIGASVAFAAAAAMPWVYASIGLILLFVVSVAMHAMMYERRPAPESLTGFYLAMSAGGVLGGLFCAIIAPVIFDWAYEHPVLIVLAGLLVVREPIFASAARLPARFAIILALFALIAALINGRALVYTGEQAIPTIVSLGILMFIMVVGILLVGRRVPFTLTLVSLMIALGGGAQSWAPLRSNRGCAVISVFMRSLQTVPITRGSSNTARRSTVCKASRGGASAIRLPIMRRRQESVSQCQPFQRSSVLLHESVLSGLAQERCPVMPSPVRTGVFTKLIPRSWRLPPTRENSPTCHVVCLSHTS